MQLSLTNSKMSYLMKKLLDTMKRIQSKKHKLGIYEIDKISSLCFGDKDVCQMMEFVRWLIFIKIVSQVVKRLKKIVIKKIVIKKIVIIEKKL